MGALVNVPIQDIAQTALANQNSAIDAVRMAASNGSASPAPAAGSGPPTWVIWLLVIVIAYWLLK